MFNYNNNIMEQNIKLGDYAKDMVTGFTGTVVAITEWLHGCKRLTLQPKVSAKGEALDSVSFDLPSVVLVKSKTVERKTKTGGHQKEPTRSFKI